MRTVINTIANVTTNAIANRTVRTVVAGVDALRASLHLQRPHAAPAPPKTGNIKRTKITGVRPTTKTNNKNRPAEDMP